VAERYWVESAPGYVRLRHQLDLQGRITPPALLADGIPPEADEASAADEPRVIAGSWNTLDQTVDDAARSVTSETEDGFLTPDELDDPLEDEYQLWAEIGYLNSLDEEERERYFRECDVEGAQTAAAERAGRGAGGISDRSRAEMWRRVLSLPFEMLGDRPLWITLTYPRAWWRWVPDGRTFELHRRAFGERWRRNFGEPVGFWTKEFQLVDGRPHLHLLMKAPEPMSDPDYRGFQERTRLAKANERAHGKYDGRARTPTIGMNYGGQTAMALRRWWAEIVTGNTDRSHHARGVDVRAVFYSHIDSVALSKPRVAIAAYMAGETAKSGQKVPPLGFGTVGNYYGQWGRLAGFVPRVTDIEVDRAVWDQMNRRLTFLMGWRREVRRAKGGRVSEAWKRRRSWQGITVGGLGPEELARLMARSVAAAERQERRARSAYGLISPSRGPAPPSS
jgi:hypothetical protein